MENVNLIIAVDGISFDGSILNIKDITDYGTLTNTDRSSYGLFFDATFQDSADAQQITVTSGSPDVVDEWSVELVNDGRIKAQAFLFPIIGETNIPLAVGDVRMDVSNKNLYEWVNSSWRVTTLEASKDKSYKTSNLIDIPVLNNAYAHKNTLNLEYIRAIKNEVDNGAEQNKLFYRRTTLDYFVSLIQGAEYNWALSNFANFYEIVNTLNNITVTGKLE